MLETQLSSFASWYCRDALCVLVIVVMLRREFKPSRLGAARVAMVCLASLISDDLSSVIFGQSTISFFSFNIKKNERKHWILLIEL